MPMALVPKATIHIRQSIDFIGIAIFTTALFSLIFMLDVAARWGWLSRGVIILALVAVIGIIIFIIVEHYVKEPLVPPFLMHNHKFVCALLANGLLVPAWFSSFMYIPEYLQKVLGYSEFMAAAGIVPAMAVFAILSPISGRFYAILGPRVLITLGYIADIPHR
ncbi:MAG: hypothetical protein GY821_02910 [Gammaproteobacteria bacterium]|nr:hypothetical protein [Gammaproteobacteria bacterium]